MVSEVDGAEGKEFRVCQEVRNLFRGKCGQWRARREWDILGHNGALGIHRPSLLMDPII